MNGGEETVLMRVKTQTVCACVCVQEVWACWCELLSYLEQENAFLDQLEQKLDETDNLEGRPEELQEAQEVSASRGTTTT